MNERPLVGSGELLVSICKWVIAAVGTPTPAASQLFADERRNCCERVFSTQTIDQGAASPAFSAIGRA